MKTSIKTKQSANKTVYVDHWFTWYGEPHNDGVTATQLPNGKWKCELTLPLLNQTVKSVASTAANAMENASKKAIPLIQEYLSEHPDIVFISRSQIHNYEFYTDEFGCTGFRQDPKHREKVGNDLLKMQLESSKAIEKAIAKIKRVNGSDKGLFVQVIDKSLFDENATTKEMQDIISRRVLDGLYQTIISWLTCKIIGNSVIAIGYTMEMD